MDLWRRETIKKLVVRKESYSNASFRIFFGLIGNATTSSESGLFLFKSDSYLVM